MLLVAQPAFLYLGILGIILSTKAISSLWGNVKWQLAAIEAAVGCFTSVINSPSQHSTAQHSAAQRSTAQHSTA